MKRSVTDLGIENIEKDMFYDIANIIHSTNNIPQDIDNFIKYRTEVVEKMSGINTNYSDIYGYDLTNSIKQLLVYFIDEKSADLISTYKYHSLQKELFNENNGGECFFRIYEKDRQYKEYPLIFYKTMYLIIASGYQGKFFEDNNSLNDISYNLMLHIKKHDAIINSDNISYPDNINMKGNSFFYMFLKNASIISVLSFSLLYLTIYFFA